jgi:hypothetical protein
MATRRDTYVIIRNERKIFMVMLARFNQPNGANAK